MTWTVRVDRAALRFLRSLDETGGWEAYCRIEELADDPFPPDAAPMEGWPNIYRMYFAGQYRLIFRVNTHQRMVRAHPVH